ncbi:MAG TPA: hypothetical protein PL182_01420 [Pseudobdellovibrionaceae bacterium]|nr:hypothetical protein [Pseudobdellovibrionaceae bacterium]
MKKTLLIAALSMAATPAFASKARLSALGNAEHLSDIQQTFDRPYEATMHGEYATLEFGGAAGAPNAEAGFNRQVSEGNYLGFYVNRKPTALVSALSTAPAAAQTAINPLLDNSFNVFYGSRAGEIAWGVNLYYLTSNKKQAYGTAPNDFTGKADVAGLSLGAAAGNWEADAIIGLQGKATVTNVTSNVESEFKSTSNVTVRGAYKMDNMYYFAKYGMGGGKFTSGGTDVVNTENTNIEVGLVNSMKSEGAEFFYGVSYVMGTSKEKVADTKTENNLLPLVVGVEAEANSWMVLRGSVTHVLPFLSTTKDAAGDKDTASSNTTIAAGAGFKAGKFNVDVLAAAATTGGIAFDSDAGTNQSNFLTNASLTYNF